MAEIVCYSTKPDPCHYTTLLNADVLIFCLTLDLLQSDCSDLVSKWRGHTVTTIFLLGGHYQTCAGCTESIFYVSTGWHLDASARDTVAFYTAYSFSHFAIYLPKLIKLGGNLTKFWQKQKCTVFLGHGVKWCNKSNNQLSTITQHRLGW